jgi:hypothetical protein
MRCCRCGAWALEDCSQDGTATFRDRIDDSKARELLVALGQRHRSLPVPEGERMVSVPEVVEWARMRAKDMDAVGLRLTPDQWEFVARAVERRFGPPEAER